MMTERVLLVVLLVAFAGALAGAIWQTRLYRGRHRRVR